MIALQTNKGAKRGAVIVTGANAQLTAGMRCTITNPTDDSDIMHRGTIVEVKPDGWYGVRIDGERVVHDWPASQVWSVS